MAYFSKGYSMLGKVPIFKALGIAGFTGQTPFQLLTNSVKALNVCYQKH